ncbi:response regulator transcription factor [Amycolatopsis sp. 195334CR]|uniref:response regulator n=1 Tax=Amycolatopsis sp. 195334CR TaxID=2814588 RepID=UPI001A8DF771|nr:response regulator transcription factor [Amycolatopsis sp. 195334CR]MBN6034196.1 response regulator transcription factor [Amycolatopsis sp. 195334CR]
MGADQLDRQVTVAVIEDHEVVIDGVRAWVDRDPERRVRVVASGADVDQVLAGPGGTADVLLVDLNLRGTLIVDRIAALTGAGHRVVVFSAHSETENVLAVLDAGAEFLEKDESREHCVETIVAAAAGRPYVTPSTAGAMIADTRPLRPTLSKQQLTALRYWFQGMSKASVGMRMGISEATVKLYIDRARAKYDNVGRRASTKDTLLARTIQDGLIRPDEIGEYQSRANRAES